MEMGGTLLLWVLLGVVLGFGATVGSSGRNTTDCYVGAFRCKKSGECIDHFFVCDGKVDCSNGRDEKPDSCARQCQNGTKPASPGSSIQDQDWWYVCKRGMWRAMGCVVNGKRYNIGDAFLHDNEFWGKCEQNGDKSFKRSLYGCLDSDKRLMKAGERYLVDSHFWAVCRAYNKSVALEGGSTATVQAFERKIIGCNDSSDEVVADGEEFLSLADEQRGLDTVYVSSAYAVSGVTRRSLSGVAMQCKISSSESEWPQVIPVSCLVQDKSNQDEFTGLSDGCYDVFGHLIYYCTITAHVTVRKLENNRLNGTWTYQWLLGWNSTSQKTIDFLESKGFSRCLPDPDEDPPVGSRLPGRKGSSKSNSITLRRFRHRHKRSVSVPAKISVLYHGFGLSGTVKGRVR